MTAPLTVYLVRHGEVQNPKGILYGRLPGYYLSEAGRKQATAAGRALARKNIAAIYASPMERTQETAKHIIAERKHPIPITVDERLIEVHSPYDGTPHTELEAIHFDLYTGNEPPHEQPQDIRRRLIHFLTEMRQEHANQEIIAVTHGDIVVSGFMFAKNQDANDIGRTRIQANRIQSLGLPEIYPATASISTLAFSTDDPDEIPKYSYERPYSID